MTERSVTHGTFRIERVYDAKPARVFRAWADPEVKARWFRGPDQWRRDSYRLDFRVGGTERLSGGKPGEPMHIYTAAYHDIVAERRIIIAYDMHVGETPISVSLATIELTPEGKGTRLVFTEQGAFLDGYDDAGGRERGTMELLDKLDGELRRGDVAS